MEIKEIISQLIKQCKIESISMVDLSKELVDLYEKIKCLETSLEFHKKEHEKMKELKIQNEQRLQEYMVKYVMPEDKLKSQRETLENDLFKFGIEKEYITRELKIYQEIVASLTAKHVPYSSYSGGNNGEYYNHGANIDKPSLPGKTLK